MDKQEFNMIKIHIPRGNVHILNHCVLIKFNYFPGEKKDIYFFIEAPFGYLNKDKEGFGYFTILIKPNSIYHYHLEDIINGKRVVKVSGSEFSKLIYNGIKGERENYD